LNKNSNKNCNFNIVEKSMTFVIYYQKNTGKYRVSPGITRLSEKINSLFQFK